MKDSSVINFSNMHFSYFLGGQNISGAILVKTIDFEIKISNKSYANLFVSLVITTNH